MFRIGIGQDTHRLVAGRPLILAASALLRVRAEGHSDSDALAHALIDALLGAMSDGDIVVTFRQQSQVEDADSFDMLAHVLKRVRAADFMSSTPTRP